MEIWWTVAGFLSLAGGTIAADRPNIVFAFADDWGRYASAYAKVRGEESIHAVFQTPNVDRVAREGVLFTNAFVTAPSCTPCRSSLLSGQYFFRTGLGAILQGAQWDPEIPTFPLLLKKDAGYHIGFTYKVWSPGVPPDAGIGGKENGYHVAGRRFNQFSQNVTKMVENGKPLAEAKGELLAEVKGNFESFLAARKGTQPFCYWFGPTNTHRKWIKGSGKALWGIDPDRLKGRLPAFLPDEAEVREDFADYLGEAAAFDAGVGVLLAKLEEIGELDNTLVVLSGDHGAPGFPRGKCNLYDFGTGVSLMARWPGAVPAGRVVEDFVNLMDLAPTFLEAGGLKAPAVMTGRSLMPVLRSEKAGQVDPARSWVITGRERHAATAREGNLPYPQRALRTADYLYIVNFEPDRWPIGSAGRVTPESAPSWDELANDTFAAFPDLDAGPTKAFIVLNRNEERIKPFYDFAFGKRPREELYILSEDPYQMQNRAGDKAWEKVRGELRDQLMAELRRTGDPRVTGDGKTFERPPFVP